MNGNSTKGLVEGGHLVFAVETIREFDSTFTRITCTFKFGAGKPHEDPVDAENIRAQRRISSKTIRLGIILFKGVMQGLFADFSVRDIVRKAGGGQPRTVAAGPRGC